MEIQEEDSVALRNEGRRASNMTSIGLNNM
jgi:hypothetical protein